MYVGVQIIGGRSHAAGMGDPIEDEVLAYIEDLVLPSKADGDVDPVFGRSVQFEVRPELLLFCDVDSVTKTVEVLSLELLVAKSGLA